MAPASRLLRRKENTMITLFDPIQELRAELRGCRFTRRERAAVQAELANAIAEQAELDRAFDAALEAVSNPPRRSGPPRERPPLRFPISGKGLRRRSLQSCRKHVLRRPAT
jgi:hypothetical protein